LQIAANGGAGGAVPRFRHQLLQTLIVVAVRIGKARRGHAEPFFQLKARMEKLSPCRFGRNQRQPRMGERVGSDLDAVLAELLYLGPAHERRFTPGIPTARPTDLPRDDKHGRGKAVPRENRIGMAENTVVAVVEREDDGPTRCAPFPQTSHCIAQAKAKIS
jgi:hypothetical protein